MKIFIVVNVLKKAENKWKYYLLKNLQENNRK